MSVQNRGPIERDAAKLIGEKAGVEDEGLNAVTTEHEIIDEALYRAILHGIAAGACEAAARETRSAYWAGMAEDQRGKAMALLHQAASVRMPACATASTSKVMPKPLASE